MAARNDAADALTSDELRAVFEAGSEACVVLVADPPRFTIVAATEPYLRRTMTKRDEILGRGLFEVFPLNPADSAADGMVNLRESLERAVERRTPQSVPVQRYDIRGPDGTFETRYWTALDTPVLDTAGRVTHIVHRVQDVTDSRAADVWARALQSVITTSNDAVMITEPGPLDHPGPRIVYVNEGLVQMTGYSPGEIIGQSPRILQGPGTDRAVTARIRAALERREPIRAELLNYRRDGTPFWVDLLITPSFDADGALAYYIAVQRDMTERKAAERAAIELAREQAALAEVRSNEARLRSIFDSSMDAVLLASSDGGISLANRAACEMFGYSEDELRRLGRAAIVDPTDLEIQHALEDLARKGRFRGEVTMKRRDGTPVPVETSSGFFRDEHGRTWTSVFIRNVADRRRHEAERARLLAGLDAERRWYEAVLDHIPIGIVLVEPGGRTYFNRHSEELFGGLNPASASATSFANAMLYLDGTPVPPEQLALARVLRTGETMLGAEFLVERPDGTRVPVLASAAPIPDSSGKTIGAVGTFQDITARIHAEQATRASERLLSAILDLMPVGLWVVDEAGLIVRENPAAVRLWAGEYRVGASNLSERKGWRVENGEPIAPDDWALERAVHKGETTVGELVRIQTRDGQVKSVVNAAMPLYDDAQRFAGAIAVHQDVTRLLEIDEALRRAVRAREELLGVVAHDLRSPLNSIHLQLQLLRRRSEHLTPANAEIFDNVHALIKRIDRLVGDLLDVASIDAGVLSVTRTAVPTERALRDVLDAQRAMASAASIRLDLAVQSPVPHVWADADRLAQVFENLIGNAMKFTPRGGSITVGAVPRDHDVLFSVADTGPGVPAEQLPYLFDRFWQASRADRRGAGLGLAIVKGIVESHGGRVWVESTAGAGTTFYFTIPSVAESQAR